MPIFEAKRLCPDAAYVRPRFDAYREASAKVRQAMEDLTPLVEMVSIDEAYLDLAGTERLHGRSPAASLIRLQRRIEAEVGVTVSVGLSHNKSLAKMASELDKPRGFAVIGQAETLSLLASRPIGEVRGVGRSFAAKLKADGISHVADIQAMGARELMKRYGEAGLRLYNRSVGHDPRPVTTERLVKSISSETTFGSDMRDLASLEDQLYGMCRKVSERAAKKGLAGSVVTLKLKTRTFRTLTRRKSLGLATNLTDVLFAEGRLLLKAELEANPAAAYRLIGIGLSDLVPEADLRLDLAYPEEHDKLRDKENALRALRNKFGDSVIGTMRDRRSTRT